MFLKAGARRAEGVSGGVDVPARRKALKTRASDMVTSQWRPLNPPVDNPSVDTSPHQHSPCHPLNLAARGLGRR